LVAAFGTHILEWLREEVASIPLGEIGQFAEDLITVSLVEIWRLEAECVQVRIVRTATPSLIFSERQDTVPKPASAKLVCHPK
jgi:hypothetical protein